jgi:hypothetical protein
MSHITKQQFAEYVKGFKLRELFIDGLGWNNDHTAVQPFEVDGVRYAPKILADKNGFKIIECRADAVPLYSARSQALNALKTRFAELLVIFTDSKQTRQIWIYGYKVSGQNKKAECEFRAGQDPEALYERAAGLFFSLDDEGNITILDVINRVRSNFTANAERVTKRFYNEFKTRHTALLGFIQGITESVDKEWYASIMLNRLMFCYFMQKRGFLDKNRNYLRDKLAESKEKLGHGKFYSFYRSFLMTLFRKGFGAYEHTPEIKAMIGDIPYLNGGLFDLHEIERTYPDIDISDEAFERIFTLFDRYEWHLDTRECASGNEISPDVLGYIFEKYINDRAAMGAYYTQEDITGYISRNTILPYLLEATKKAYGKPFEPGGSVWKFLKESGNRYIFESVKRGMEETLPDNIAKGVDTEAPNLIERRKDWNKPVPESVDHLPTEIWREFIERTKRCRVILAKINDGEIHEISDFITYNLDIVSFVGDLLDTIEDPRFILVFYSRLEKVTVLDPTCGSGAFLFAAMNILEPLYDSCLSRMADYLSHDYKDMPERSIKRYFDEKLEQMESDIHPNKHYFIYKSIILNNLYGVDIMKEAVETAKLRLFLKLVSTAEPNYRAENIGIEPLPDIDFNIKAGNTLIGYANEQEVQNALHENLFGMTKISETMGAMLQLSKAVSRYKQLQLGEGDYRVDDFKEAKAELSARQSKLRATLDKLLRDNDYGDGVTDDAWQNNYAPFHWVSEFYSIIVEDGGFDVVIGNPPDVEYGKVRKSYTLKNYKTISCGNLYAFVIERAQALSGKLGVSGMIIPHSAFCTDRMSLIHDLFDNSLLWVSSYDVRPAKLFNGVEQRLAIYLQRKGQQARTLTTKYNRWNEEARDSLFESLCYLADNKFIPDVVIKNQSPLFDTILEKINVIRAVGIPDANYTLYYHNAPRYWIRATKDAPYFYNDRGGEGISTQVKQLTCINDEFLYFYLGLLNSSLFYLWFIAYSDSRHLNAREIQLFPMPNEAILSEDYREAVNALMADYERNKHRKETVYASTGKVVYDEYYPKRSKPIIDRIDTILAKHYGFTEEELDYIINYDIKYRMGIGGSAEGGDEE